MDVIRGIMNWPLKVKIEKSELQQKDMMIYELSKRLSDVEKILKSEKS